MYSRTSLDIYAFIAHYGDGAPESSISILIRGVACYK